MRSCPYLVMARHELLPHQCDCSRRLGVAATYSRMCPHSESIGCATGNSWQPHEGQQYRRSILTVAIMLFHAVICERRAVVCHTANPSLARQSSQRSASCSYFLSQTSFVSSNQQLRKATRRHIIREPIHGPLVVRCELYCISIVGN